MEPQLHQLSGKRTERLTGTYTVALALCTVLALAVAPLINAAEHLTDQVALQLEANGLEPLADGWAYEGWLIVDGTPVSTGVFAIDANGQPTPAMVVVGVSDRSAIEAFVVSIEPVPDPDPSPASVKLLGGGFSNGTATATIAHPAALGSDLGELSGEYILNAPSDGEDRNYRNGIWWLDPMAGPGPTLNLPSLPEAWVYEGWVVGPDGPMSTGRFSMASGYDSDRGGLTSGPHDTPPFPGQDLVVPPVDLTTGYAAVISVEPEPDTSPTPFTLKPLVDGEIEDVGEGVLQSMSNMSANAPTLTATMLAEPMTRQTRYLQLDLDGLTNLGSEFAYEGWLIVNGSPMTTGVFTVDGAGVPSQAIFPVKLDEADHASAFVLTIEPMPDTDPAPSAVHILGGDVVDGRATLSVAHGAAIGTDFSEMSGSYILNAPSDGADRDWRNGIWWLDPSNGFEPTLELPELPSGWTYEGWVVSSDDGPMTTGKFTSASGADSDGAGPTSGPEDFPPFPGQDFVDPPVDLTTGFAAVISVEPEPDNSPAPFALKPLKDPHIDSLGEGVLQPMHLNTAPLPMGTALLLETRVVPVAAHQVGLNGTLWRTSVDVANHGLSQAEFTLVLTPADGSPAMMETYSLAPGSAVRFDDVLQDAFGGEGLGILQVLTSEPAVAVSSRTFTETIGGSYGQGIPAEMRHSAIRFGETARLTGLSQSADSSSGFRSNLGFANPSSMNVDVHVRFLAADGSEIEQIDLALPAGALIQLDGPLPGGTRVASAAIWTSTPGGQLMAYGSAVDNASGDATYLRIQR